MLCVLSNATQCHHEAFLSSQSKHIAADIVFPRVFKNYFGMSHPCKLSCPLSVLWAVTVSVFPHLSWFFWRFKKHPSMCVWHFSDNYSSLVALWGDTWSFLNTWQRCTRDPDDGCVSSDGYLMTWGSQCLTGFVTEFPVVPLHAPPSERDLLNPVFSQDREREQFSSIPSLEENLQWILGTL